MSGRTRWMWLVPAVVIVGAVLALTLVDNVETCPSCVGNPCPCTVDYRVVPRLLIFGVAVLLALGVWLAARARSIR